MITYVDILQLLNQMDAGTLFALILLSISVWLLKVWSLFMGLLIGHFLARLKYGEGKKVVDEATNN